jgi:O-antigen/teichoic acid export membrane protein
LLLNFGQLLHSLRQGTLFLLASRFIGKALLLVFLLVLASQLRPRAFLDLEVISSLINFLIWIFLAFTFSIARIGSVFQSGELDMRLKGLLQHTQTPALLTGLLISTVIIVAGFLLDQAGASHTLEIRLIVALFALVQFLYSYLLGFHQARESYRLVGVFYLVPGIMALAAAVLFLYLDLGLRAALLTYLTGAVAQLLLAYVSLRRSLMRVPTRQFTGIPRRIGPGLVRISVGITLFFAIYSMDILAAKFLLDPASGETYARLEFLGRILFTIVATMGFAFFVRIVRAYDDRGSYLSDTGFRLTLVVVAGVASTAALLPYLYSVLFGTRLADLVPAMLMVVAAKMVQSFLFVVVTIKGATVSRYVLRWLTLVLASQTLLFVAFHDSIEAIARNILLSGVLSVILFSASFLYERKVGELR